MSISSGSDVTIPIHDSPPPPPSPYQNTTNRKSTDAEAGISGIENKGYQSAATTLNEGKAQNNGKVQTEIPLEHYTDDPENAEGKSKVTEAVNTELVQGHSVLDTIPHKPQSEFGPYEKFPEYFISVNQHKKFFTRGEKLSVTKDKRRGSGTSVKKCLCWLLSGFVIAAIITLAVVATVGLFPEKSSGGTYSMREMTTTTLSPGESTLYSTTSSDLSSSVSPGDAASTATTTTETAYSSSPETTETAYSSSPATTETAYSSSPATTESGLFTTEAYSDYVPNAAEVELRLAAEFEDELEDKSSLKFKSMATEIETAVKLRLEANDGIDKASTRITEFRSGSIISKLRISWSRLVADDPNPDFRTVQRLVSSWKDLGNYTLERGTVVDQLYNQCKLSSGGCSHTCAFDETLIQFVCTCPIDKVLDTDNKTCVDPLPLTTLATATEPISTSTPTPEIHEEPVTVTTTTTSTTEEPIVSTEQPQTGEAESTSAETPAATEVSEDASDIATRSPIEPLTTTAETRTVTDGGSSEGDRAIESNVTTTTLEPHIVDLLTHETTPVTVTDSLPVEVTSEKVRSAEQDSAESDELELTTVSIPESDPENSEAEADLPLTTIEPEVMGNNTGKKSSRAYDSNEEEVTEEPSLINRPVVTHSDEFMVYSDMDMGRANTTVTPVTTSDELGNTMSGEESPESVEPHKSEQMIVSNQEIVPISDMSIEPEREEVTTTLPISLVNDTLVNYVTEGVTEEVNSEMLPPSDISSHVVDGSAEGVIIDAKPDTDSTPLPESDEPDDLAKLVEEVHSEMATPSSIMATSRIDPVDPELSSVVELNSGTNSEAESSSSRQELTENELSS